MAQNSTAGTTPNPGRVMHRAYPLGLVIVLVILDNRLTCSVKSSGMLAFSSFMRAETKFWSCYWVISVYDPLGFSCENRRFGSPSTISLYLILYSSSSTLFIV